jgi:hypothetical protein
VDGFTLDLLDFGFFRLDGKSFLGVAGRLSSVGAEEAKIGFSDAFGVPGWLLGSFNVVREGTPIGSELVKEMGDTD